jgi:transposase
MRGNDREQDGMFSYVSMEARIPEDHPLRAVKRMADEALRGLWRRFESLYSTTGRPSIPPEQLLRALLLQALYSVRSERLLVEQLEYNLLFRWFVGLAMDDRVWDATVFSKNRERLVEGEIARAFLSEVLGLAEAKGLISDEHFTVDGTLLEASASHKSFRPKDGSGPQGGGSGSRRERDFHGERRLNDTHGSTTDPESRLYRKGTGKESKLCFLGHVLVDNRHGLVVDADTTLATGTAEGEAAIRFARRLRRRGRRRATLAGDKGYDRRGVVEGLRQQGVTPHVAQRVKGTAIDQRTTRHAGYAISQWKRKQVEQVFGWMKTVATLRKLRHRGRRRVGWTFTFAAAAYNLVRMRTLTCTP